MTAEEKEVEQASANPFEQEAEKGNAEEEVPATGEKKEKISNRETLLNFLRDNKEKFKKSKK